MTPTKNDTDREYAIIGLGRFGSSLARRLESLGHPVLGIDNDPAIVKEIADELTEAVILDATDEDALREVDITAFRTVIISISRNFEANALITSTLKKWGVTRVISLSNTTRHREILIRIGADRVILPEEESGYRLADELSIPGIFDHISLSPNYSLIEINSPALFVGRGLDVCDEYGIYILLILRGDELIINPDQNLRFLPEDRLVLVGEKTRLLEINRPE
jgi:trk system potassium uptake protein